ncbi:MAG: glutathione S-transferase family protein [Gammaproteobacteria bacterium]|nr:glutathione S-transferase family protein [Gammaproteobacteria bacterium]
MRLILGNCNYSSWSLRTWLIARHAEVAFEELRIPLYEPDSRTALQAYCPAGKVPVLEDGVLRVWDSLAIAEYLAERHTSLWPRASAARARARSMCAEMHAGFAALRDELPMNCRRTPGRVAVSARCGADIDRVVELWDECLADGTGPWLFADWSIVDAFFAPVALRLHTYAIPVADLTQTYVDKQLNDPFVQEWCARGAAEIEVIEVAEKPVAAPAA